MLIRLIFAALDYSIIVCAWRCSLTWSSSMWTVAAVCWYWWVKVASLGHRPTLTICWSSMASQSIVVSTASMCYHCSDSCFCSLFILLCYLHDTEWPECADVCLCLQCFDTVGMVAGRASGLWKTEWLGAGVVICLERGADLHIAQLMPLPLTVSCFSKIQIGYTFLVLDHPGSPGQRAFKRVCVCVRACMRVHAWRTHACTCVCWCVYFTACCTHIASVCGVCASKWQKSTKSTCNMTCRMSCCPILS